jgi:hypothetical protein
MSAKPGRPASKNQGKGNKKPFVNPHRVTNGTKGFLFSFLLNREKEGKREAYSVLNKYADILYGPEHQPNDDESDQEMSIEDALKAEIKTIKSTKKSRRFTVQQAFGCTLFVACDPLVVNPTQLAEFIVENQRGDRLDKISLHYILRIEPVQVRRFT